VRRLACVTTLKVPRPSAQLRAAFRVESAQVAIERSVDLYSIGPEGTFVGSSAPPQLNDGQRLPDNRAGLLAGRDQRSWCQVTPAGPAAHDVSAPTARKWLGRYLAAARRRCRTALRDPPAARARLLRARRWPSLSCGGGARADEGSFRPIE